MRIEMSFVLFDIDRIDRELQLIVRFDSEWLLLSRSSTHLNTNRKYHS
jgi:hypothetical protein